MDRDHELAALRARVAQLEELVGRLTGRHDPESVGSPDGVSRRRMLRHGVGLGAAAVGGLGVVDAVFSPAAASDGDSVLVAKTSSPSSAGSDPTRIANPSTTTPSAVLLQVDNSTDASVPMPANTVAAIVGSSAGTMGSPPPENVGILGLTDTGTGVEGRADDGVGVFGVSKSHAGVMALSTFGVGLEVNSYQGAGIDVRSASVGIAVSAQNDDGIRATTYSSQGIGVYGKGPIGVAGEGQPVTGGMQTRGVVASGDFALDARGTVIGVYGESQKGIGVEGVSTSSYGVKGTSDLIGVYGTSDSGAGVGADSTSGTAVSATSSSGFGVHADSDSGSAVMAHSTSGTAVVALSQGGPAITATSSTNSAIIAQSTYAVALSANGGQAQAVSAVSTGTVAAEFRGADAAVRLCPTSTPGPAIAGGHKRGELLVDGRGHLWLCTKQGTPGVWRQVALL